MALERTFDVGADCATFSSYVNRLRDDLRDPTRAPLFQDVSILRPFTTVPQQWLHLTLVVESTAIVVRVRTDNLYVVGFARRGATRAWEFLPDNGNHQSRHLIDGSEFLRFTGSYTNHGIGDIRPEQRDLGLEQLGNAIRRLADYTGQVDQQDSARAWLRTIVLTFSESIRSQVICDHVGDLLRGGGSDGPTTRMIHIIRNWSKISACLIRSANDPGSQDMLYSALRVIDISNTYLARQAVAIVYHGPSEHAEHENAGAVDDVPTGLTLVEIFQVVILDIDGEDPGDLYGAIIVNDGLNSQVLFSRDRSNTQSVGPRGLAELTGPARAVWGYDEVIIDVNLMDKDSFPDISPDDQISKGQIVWNMYDTPEDQYNEVKDHVVNGENGAVKVRYAVITNAVVATVVVVLTNGDDESWPDLYGTLTAATAMFNSVKITLFDRKRDDIVQVQAGARIPLLRNVFVVPVGSSLKINADLWDRDSFPDLSPDDQIAKGEATFDTRAAGTEETKDIRGPSGVVTVNVAWSCN